MNTDITVNSVQELLLMCAKNMYKAADPSEVGSIVSTTL